MTMASDVASRISVEVAGRQPPPNWAVKQRHLIDLMDRAARTFVEKYTRPDGTFVWRKEWPGMDGSDDGYESFVSFPLFYVLGGGEHVHDLARKEWNAVTWQFTRYGQVHREFDAYYDWMHHGESYTYIYYLALANPYHTIDRGRALAFASMYAGDDPDAPNWDPKLRMIRSPINGSKGPRFEMTAEDWVTHRHVLAQYLAPYEDIPGVDSADPFVVVDWNDDEMFARVLKLMNERMVPGDVPLNLTATSLITSAYMYSAEKKYERWVLDYLQAWKERQERNKAPGLGINPMPDNIGPTGEIGERMNGKWWGGYYGWRWPHGVMNILESTLIAGCNATLLTGDPSWLDLHRSQIDLLWSLREERAGEIVVPAKYGDQGWFDYRPPRLSNYVRLYFMSRSGEDLARLEERFPPQAHWEEQRHLGKSGSFSPEDWFAYVEGKNPGFPDQVLDDTYRGICQRMDRIDADDDNVEEWDVHHWQNLNPVVPEGLIQMSMGTPAAVYHGGLLHASVRYFDPLRRRPGLAEHVAALVERITPDGILLTLVNTDPLEEREILVQAGAFGEHKFTAVKVENGSGVPHEMVVDSKYLRVALGPSAQARLDVGLERFAYRPSYEFPPFA